MLTPHEQGVLVNVWVVPGASRDRIVGEHRGALKIQVGVPAEGGKANRRVTDLVAAALGVRRATIVRGSGSRRKQILVRGVTPDSAQAHLRAIVD